MLVWTNFSLHYQSSIGFLCIPHKTYNSIILCILRMREIMKRGKWRKIRWCWWSDEYDMRRNKKSLLFHQIHWIKVSLLCTQTSADKPQKYSMLFFAFYHFLCDMYLVWDWCWSFRFAQPDLFRTYKDSQTGNFCYTYCENVLFSSHDAIIGNKFLQTIKIILRIYSCLTQTGSSTANIQSFW